MNYRHIYHAGNFADVFKHCILIMLAQALCRKEKGFCYLDTHAGIGKYNLTSDIAQKTREYENGIMRLWNIQDCPEIIKTYKNIIQAFNTETTNENKSFPHFYPGSPGFAHSLLRPQDRMILVELHERDIFVLKQKFAHDKRIAIHHTDGYQSIKAFLPPKENRGLILLDPPFEASDEFRKIIDALKIAENRFPTGIYAVWYPIKEIEPVKKFHKELKLLNFKNLLLTEISLNKAVIENELIRCGMVIINAPWKFDKQVKPIVAWLQKTINAKL